MKSPSHEVNVLMHLKENVGMLEKAAQEVLSKTA